MKIVGFEALLRWNHPKQGLLTAGDFIESLERSDFIFPVGEWIIESVCKQIAAWEDAGIHGVRVAINLSAKQFLSDRLEAIVDRSLTTHQIDPEHVQFEITESSIVENTDEAIQIMRRLNAKGMHISIDDFGTGYSSLINLKRYPLSTVKIDRSFIRDITTDPDDAAIVKAVISMAHALNLMVVAEGVETKEQLEFLVAQACDEVQGFYFSPAIPAAQCNEVLRSQGYQPIDHGLMIVNGIKG
jgi:EAL domain-containing protein (putative c-di-GMP-specific phosphodiesterase class I)